MKKLSYQDALKVHKNSYEQFYNIPQENPSFKFFDGDIEGIIFSCPHAVSQLREGIEKYADINTGPFGLALNSLGYKVLIKTKNCDDDANYDLKSDYKDYLSKLIKKYNIKYLIDLHGMSKKRDVLFALGTCFSENADHSLELTHQLIKIADKNNLDAEKIRIDFPFASSSKRQVATAINIRNKIETLQMEINSKLYEDDESVLNLIKTVDEFARLVNKIKLMPSADIKAKEVYKLEKLFSDNTEKESFSVMDTNSDIMITSPHSQSMIKEGRECYKETFAGGFCLAFAEKYNLSSVVKSAKTDYDSSSEYLSNVQKIIKNKKIVIEFHVMNKNRYEDISIITNQGFSIGGNFEIIASILKALSVKGFSKVGLDYPFNAFNKNSTVSLIYKNFKVPALQFIINQKIFDNKFRLKKLIIAVEEMIKKLSCLI